MSKHAFPFLPFLNFFFFSHVLHTVVVALPTMHCREHCIAGIGARLSLPPPSQEIDASIHDLPPPLCLYLPPAVHLRTTRRSSILVNILLHVFILPSQCVFCAGHLQMNISLWVSFWKNLLGTILPPLEVRTVRQSKVEQSYKTTEVGHTGCE